MSGIEYRQVYLKKDAFAGIRAATIALAVLMAVMSALGLFFTGSIYTAPDQVQSYRANDLLNLMIGLPVLLAAMQLAGRGHLTGLLFWPGSILYVLYNYTALLVGVPLGWPSLPYAVLVILSVYLLAALLRSMDAEALQKRLTGVIHERLSGGILVLFGVGFFFLAAQVVHGAASGEMVTRPDIGLAAADILLCTMLLFGGILLMLRRPMGYAAGPGILFAAMVLFSAVIVLVIIRPWFSGPPFSWDEVIALGSMAVICLIPFSLMTRGILSGEQDS